MNHFESFESIWIIWIHMNHLNPYESFESIWIIWIHMNHLNPYESFESIWIIWIHMNHLNPYESFESFWIILNHLNPYESFFLLGILMDTPNFGGLMATTAEGKEIENLLSSLSHSQLISETTNFEPNKKKPSVLILSQGDVLRINNMFILNCRKIKLFTDFFSQQCKDHSVYPILITWQMKK